MSPSPEATDDLVRCRCPSGLVPLLVPASHPFLVSAAELWVLSGGSQMAGFKSDFCPKESMFVD